MKKIFLGFLLLPFLCNSQTIDQSLDVAKRKIASRNYIEAKADLTKLIEANPKNKNVFTLRGRAKMGLQDYYGAIGDFNFALDIDSTFAEALNYRGEAKVSLGDDDGAITDLDKAIRFNS
jgi:tetratricopeptide (TPR) repeat protein